MPIRLSQTLKKLLFVYVGIFILQNVVDQFMGGNLRGWLGLVPAGTMSGMIWQVFTYSFLHMDVMHLVLNLLVLAFVGSDIESVWGTRRFFIYYAFCIISAGLVYLLIQAILWNPAYLNIPMLGASAGIYGLLLAYGILFPDRELLFMMIFPLKAKQFVMVLAGVEFLQALFSGHSGLSAIAQLSGMGAGFLFLYFQAKGIQLNFKKSVAQKKRPSHLKLVQTNKPLNPKDDDDQRDPKTWH